MNSETTNTLTHSQTDIREHSRVRASYFTSRKLRN